MPTRIITALILLLSASAACAQAPAPAPTPAPAVTPASPSAAPALADDAPDRYTVKQGDTLWGISSKFLKEPWRWHEIWRANREEIASPHRIYPGQVLILDKSGAVPVLKPAQMLTKAPTGERLEPRIYDETKDTPIPAIPPRLIQPFLSEPKVVEAGALDDAPRIIATEEDRVYLGVGNLAYVTGIKSEKTKNWQAFRPVAPVRNPDGGGVLGYEAFFVGTLAVKKPGDPATMVVTSAKREIGSGDLLQPAAPPDIPVYAPHAPAAMVAGRVASIYEGVGEAGRNSIVTINLGKTQGLEVGHVLALYRLGRTALYRGPQGGEKPKEYLLPPERFGLVFVFRVFDRMSYALIMNTSRPVNVGDAVQTP